MRLPWFCVQLYLDRHAGNAQQEVCRCLMRLGIPYALEDKIDAFLAVDIVLRMPEHPKVAIKVRRCGAPPGLHTAKARAKQQRTWGCTLQPLCTHRATSSVCSRQSQYTS